MPAHNDLCLTLIGECIICTVQRLYNRTKRSQMPCDPSNVYEMLKRDDSFSKILDGTQYDAHDFLKHLVGKMKHPSHFHNNMEGMFAFETNIDITCLQCKKAYKNITNTTDLVVNMRGTRSVKEALQAFFENEIVQKYLCIFCMKSVLASKKWKLLSTPKCLCLIISDSNTDIKINRDLNLKCFSEGRPCHWKYELASVIHHVGASYNEQHYITTVHYNNTVYTLDDSKVLKKEGYAGYHPYILFYERVEVICFKILQFLLCILMSDAIKFLYQSENSRIMFVPKFNFYLQHVLTYRKSLIFPCIGNPH